MTFRSEDGPITLEHAATVGRFFGQAIVSLEPDLLPAGSPERSLARCVVRNQHDRAFVVERMAPAQFTHKTRIAHLLAELSASGLSQCVTYLADVRGDHVIRFAGNIWQMAPYLESVPVPRPEWAMEAWRGRAFGRFLTALADASPQVSRADDIAPFDLEAYIQRLLNTATGRHPDVAQSLRPIVIGLTPFLHALGTLPTAFCHGDVHPLNALWAKHDIHAMIDWEFCSIKPALYDVAALVGCVGIEDPHGLEGPLVEHLLHTLGKASFATPASWQWLPEMVLAVRFGWMSEWFRKLDSEMIDLELCYMRLLAAQQEQLSRQWLTWAQVSP